MATNTNNAAVTAAYTSKGTNTDAAITGSDKNALSAAGKNYNAAKAVYDAAMAAGDKTKAAASKGTMDAAHQQAEDIRAKYNYSGGTDGSEYIPTQSTQSTKTTQNATGSVSQMQGQLSQAKTAAEQQATAATDYATKQGIDELQRTQDDAQAQYNTQRNQITADAAKAQDNAALYSEARGDRGGIGEAQTNSISAAALKAKQEVNSAQTKLSTDTARQISDLRAQGEFEKADKVLQIAQNYLAQLVSLEQWQADYDLSYQQFQTGLDQWQKQYDLSVAQATGTLADGTKTYEAQSDEIAQLASSGTALLAAGIMPNAAQLAAMGMDAAQARQYILTAQLAAK